MMKSAWDLVAMAAHRTPRQLALVDDRGDRRLTYAELVEEVESIAAGLAARGVKPGTRFATALPNLFDHCLVALALHRLGAVVALLNFRLKADDIAALVERTRIEGAVILPDPELASRLRAVLPAAAPLLAAGGAAGAAEDLAACRGARESAPPYPELDPEAPSMIFFTSGTTGLPKGVALAHRTHEPRVTWLPTQIGFRGGTHLRSLAISPLSHAIGYHGIFLSTLAFNGTFYALSPLEPSRALDVIERDTINYLFTLPTILQALVDAPTYSPARMKSVETVYWGGAPIHRALYDRLRREWPAKLGHIYGTTETMCALCNPEPADQPDVLLQAYGSRVRIADLADFDRTVAPGAEGELLIDATPDAIFSGYLDRPDATAEKLRGGWYLDRRRRGRAPGRQRPAPRPRRRHDPLRRRVHPARGGRDRAAVAPRGARRRGGGRDRPQVGAGRDRVRGRRRRCRPPRSTSIVSAARAGSPISSGRAAMSTWSRCPGVPLASSCAASCARSPRAAAAATRRSASRISPGPERRC